MTRLALLRTAGSRFGAPVGGRLLCRGPDSPPTHQGIRPGASCSHLPTEARVCSTKTTSCSASRVFGLGKRIDTAYRGQTSCAHIFFFVCVQSFSPKGCPNSLEELSGISEPKCGNLVACRPVSRQLRRLDRNLPLGEGGFCARGSAMRPGTDFWTPSAPARH